MNNEPKNLNSCRYSSLNAKSANNKETIDVSKCWAAEGNMQKLCSIYVNFKTESDGDQMSKNPEYFNPARDKFPIIAYYPYRPGVDPTKAEMETIQDCGFTTIIGFPYLNHPEIPNYYDRVVNQINLLVDSMNETELTLILSHSSFRVSQPEGSDEHAKYEISTIVDRIQGISRITGWFQKYYPYQSQMEWLKRLSDYIVETDKSGIKRIIVNAEVSGMFGSYHGVCTSMQNFINYMEYVLEPGVWLFDAFPFSIKSPSFPSSGGYIGSEVKVSYSSFYDAYELYSFKSRYTHVPVWGACQTLEMYDTSSKIARPAINESRLRFMVFSALAYGAQGLVYFDYATPVNDSVHEKYVSALTDENGEKTAAWYAAQKVNREVQTLSSVFLGCQMIEVRHKGKDKGTLGCELNFDHPFGPFSDIQCDENASLLVSQLANGPLKYVLIVNKDVENPAAISLIFPEYWTVTWVMLISVNGEENLSIYERQIDSSKSFNIGAGGYLLLRWYHRSTD